MIKQKLHIILLFIIIFAHFSCTELSNEPRNENKPPDTEIFLFPDNVDSLNQQKSRLSVHWWGEDPDGIVLGYYFRWTALSKKWSFTTANDSLFSLPIGSANTTYLIEVMAVDIEGNKKYDNSVIWNGEDIGPEPFIDANGNGVWDKGETYYDIGLIDPTPASMKFPIKNSPPEVEWNKESVIPEETFPVITVAWDASDLDGNESIVSIDLAINDINQAVQLPGNTRLVTLRIKDVNAANPEFEILINGSEDKIFDKTLTGLQLNNFNRLYIKAIDISGSSSEVQALPDTSRTWFVKKPKGELLIVDDFVEVSNNAETFYNNLFSEIDNGSYANKFDILDIEKTHLPFSNITFLETMKLFKYIYWYSDTTPSLELTSSVTQKYIINGGKIAYSMNIKKSSSSFEFDLTTIQSFLPIENFGEDEPLTIMYPGANAIPKSDTTANFSDYPQLRTAVTVSYVRTYIPNSKAKGVHNLSSSQINGTISLLNNNKELFFIGLPLHNSDAINGSVKALIEKVFIDEFGM